MPTNVLGVRFREATKIYHFAPLDDVVRNGEYVVVQTARGEEMAVVVTEADASAGPPPSDVRPILRLAHGDDRRNAEAQGRRAEEMYQRMKRLAAELDLQITVVACQINLEGTHGTCHFQAEQHVDFRRLQDSVAAEFGLQVHMMQVGERERAKLTDGHGLCGQRLCCSSWLTSFPQVGIKMAKEQSLSLNPDKISGVCGRLLCCLTYEYDTYREMRGTLPRLGKKVSTPVGQGRVVAVNVLKQSISIEVEGSRERVEVPAVEIGTTVRVESAPNQALIDEVAQRSGEGAGAAPAVETGGDAKPRSRRRRRRGTRSGETRAPEASASGPAPPSASPGEGAGRPEARADGPGAGQAAPKRRRRRRSRRTGDGGGSAGPGAG